MIGAGSFVSFESEIPSGSVSVGSPAVVVKALSPAQLNQIKKGLSIYQDLTRRYLKSFSLSGVSIPGQKTSGALS
jgi:carbonic anhydrase/acetyltransferase-like protein (isoleucine patch superfamily)